MNVVLTIVKRWHWVRGKRNKVLAAFSCGKKMFFGGPGGLDFCWLLLGFYE